jgi:hypothetical protein
VRAIFEQQNTKHSIPEELVEYIQCVEMYHCTPNQLAKEDETKLNKHWIIHNEIAAINARKQNKASNITTIDANENFDDMDVSKL